MSNALARLRDALGDPLVTRKGRGDASLPTRAIEIAMCWHEKTHADPRRGRFGGS